MQKYRVRFFTHLENNYEKLINGKAVQFWDVADKFKETPQYSWVENNDIKLQWHEDEVYIGYGKQYIIYGDLDEKQYTEYALRFFKFEEEWK